MHIPDGFLDPWICLLFYFLSFLVLSYSAYRTRGQLKQRMVPVIGIVAAGVFTAQMLNWPIPGGTSAHFVGGALAGILLGPFVGSITMASVVSVQALLFADGGILALGANIWNMAIINVFVGYLVFKSLKRFDDRISSFMGGWVGITAAALFVGLQVGLSSVFRFETLTTTSIMVIGHGILGLIEGGITMSVYKFLFDKRPDLFNEKKEKLEVKA